MRKGILLAVSALLCASVAFAGTGQSVRVDKSDGLGQVYILGTASLASAGIDTVSFALKDAAWLQYNNDDASFDVALTGVLMNGSATAGDSVQVALDTGPTTSGPWTEVYTLANTATNLAASGQKEIDLTTLAKAVRLRIKNVNASAKTPVVYFHYLVK